MQQGVTWGVTCTPREDGPLVAELHAACRTIACYQRGAAEFCAAIDQQLQDVGLTFDALTVPVACTPEEVHLRSKELEGTAVPTAAATAAPAPTLSAARTVAPAARPGLQGQQWTAGPAVSQAVQGASTAPRARLRAISTTLPSMSAAPVVVQAAAAAPAAEPAAVRRARLAAVSAVATAVAVRVDVAEQHPMDGDGPLFQIEDCDATHLAGAVPVPRETPEVSLYNIAAAMGETSKSHPLEGGHMLVTQYEEYCASGQLGSVHLQVWPVSMLEEARTMLLHAGRSACKFHAIAIVILGL